MSWWSLKIRASIAWSRLQRYTLGRGRLRLYSTLFMPWRFGLGLFIEWPYLTFLGGCIAFSVKLDPTYGWRACEKCGAKPHDRWFSRAASSVQHYQPTGQYACAKCRADHEAIETEIARVHALGAKS